MSRRTAGLGGRCDRTCAAFRLISRGERLPFTHEDSMGQRGRRERAARNAEIAIVKSTIREVQATYANNWATGHAAHIASGAHYPWMASFLARFNRIMEIGTGDGSGTIALHALGAAVIGVECNPTCLQNTHKNLLNAGVPTVCEPRGTLAIDASNKFRTEFAEVASAMPESGVLLLEGDILEDFPLCRWLAKNPELDAITCWNVGSDKLQSSFSDDEVDYRIRVQIRAFKLANAALRPGGILHIIDRARAITPENETKLRALMVKAYQEFAEGTTMVVDEDMQSRPYSALRGTGVALIADTSVFEFDPSSIAFWSIIARKPA